ncbi:MAG: Glycosyltransferase [Parcubacteria group bacterium GW2011_GWF2_38_76]|nr:MAG: Glycosyltransferase [Parcubacteria group bacterium GW2011_GWF2_38_76]HBM45758.1 hypothetical protein [Patescibacteria group bacterium]
MKLLIITQKIDKQDPILGFFHRWVEEFVKHCEKVTVICLQKGLPRGISAGAESEAIPLGGEFDLSENVKVLSLGKEDKVSRFTYLKRFYEYIDRERNNYDAVFVHMNPEYVVLGGFFWKIWNKKIGLWYTHRNVDLKLRIAEKLADKIFTVSRESFNLKSKKVNIMGHGILISDFEKPKNFVKKEGKFRIVSVGRITPIKNLDTLIETAKILRNNNFNFEIDLVGGPTQKGDTEYFDKLKKMVAEFDLGDRVRFVGSVPNSKIREYYWNSDLSINLCPTGGTDKAVLESMASGLPVLASNKAFLEVFGPYSEQLVFKERDSSDLANKIMQLKDISAISEFLKKKAVDNFSLESLVPKILKKYEENN